MQISAIEVKTSATHKLRIIPCYNPPRNQINKDAFIDLFHVNHPTLLAGDLNSKNIRWNSKKINQNRRDLEAITSAGNIFVDAPIEATYFPLNNRHSEDVLDIFCYKNFHYYYEFEVIKDLPSDHLPVIANLVNIIVRQRIRMDWDLFKEHLSSIKFHQTYILTSNRNIDSAVDSITSKIQEAIKKAEIPKNEIKKIYALPGYIRNNIRRRNQLRHRRQKHHNTADKNC